MEVCRQSKRPFVHLTLRVKLCGRGLCAEADAARRSPPLTLMRLRTACRRDSCELTSRLGRRVEAGPHQLLRGVRWRLLRNAFFRRKIAR